MRMGCLSNALYHLCPYDPIVVPATLLSSEWILSNLFVVFVEAASLAFAAPDTTGIASFAFPSNLSSILWFESSVFEDRWCLAYLGEGDLYLACLSAVWSNLLIIQVLLAWSRCSACSGLRYNGDPMEVLPGANGTASLSVAAIDLGRALILRWNFGIRCLVPESSMLPSLYLFELELQRLALWGENSTAESMFVV